MIAPGTSSGANLTILVRLSLVLMDSCQVGEWTGAFVRRRNPRRNVLGRRRAFAATAKTAAASQLKPKMLKGLRVLFTVRWYPGTLGMGDLLIFNSNRDHHAPLDWIN